ncbi:NUMOD4 domain-containing protein [Companilactobacillus mishanensis]|uniref:NUMOD4 domain-containing protein n=2 Tax=Companilactobacillus mishanensis TaxID=2486008 RepID=UPI0030B83A2A
MKKTCHSNYDEPNEFRDVIGYEGIYEVSNDGVVRTKEGKTTYSPYFGVRHWKQRVLKQTPDTNGYMKVSLWKDGVSTTCTVHRLVATAFIENKHNLPVINHLDGHPSNNNVNNLEWATYHTNLIHAYKNGLNKSAEPIVLVNKDSFKSKYFYSKAEASNYLNRHHGYVSDQMLKNQATIGDYKIFVPF